MAGPVTDGKATEAKKEPHYSVADRMNRIPTSPHTTLIIFFVLMGWFAETIDLGGTSFSYADYPRVFRHGRNNGRLLFVDLFSWNVHRRYRCWAHRR